MSPTATFVICAAAFSFVAGIAFLVSAGFGSAAFVTRLLVATLLILAVMPGAPCLADDGVRKATIAFLRSHPITIDTSDGAIEWLRIWGSYRALASAPTPEFDLRSLPNLRELEVGDHHAVEAEFRHYGELTQLRRLTFGDVDLDCRINGDWLRHLGELQHLEFLAIHSMGLTDESLKHLLKLKNLRHIELSNYEGFSDKAIETIVRLPQLQSLEINGEFGAEAGRNLASHPKLSVLEIRTTGMTDAFLDELSASSTIQELEAISSQITDTGLQRIARRGGMTRLSVWSPLITDGGLAMIAANQKKLVQLELASRKITDAGLDAITRLEHLEMLRLRHSSITDDGIKTLARCPSLQRLFLHGCKQLTDDCADTFGDFPKLESVVLSFSGVSKPVQRQIDERLGRRHETQLEK